MNTDVAFQSSSSTGAGGVIVTDADHRLLLAAAHRYSHIPDLTGEALATRDGLLVGEQGHANVILEVDNLVLVNLLRSEDGSRSVIVGLWLEIRELGRGFSGFKLLHVNSEGNMVAHVCASLPMESNPELFWSDCFPTRLGYKQFKTIVTFLDNKALVISLKKRIQSRQDTSTPVPSRNPRAV